MLRSLLIGALLAGSITGVLFTVIQQFQVVPLILEAETYESTGEMVAPGHDHGGHSHDHEAATDNDGSQRLLFSLLANVLAGIGFSLIVAAAISFSGQTGWRKGLLWGAAGFVVFFLAPSLGLAPKLPGTSGASLLHQQLWWIATAAATAGGIAMLVFSPSLLWKGVGVLLLVIPHWVGAPMPAEAYSVAPEALAERFVIASGLANASFWLILGALSGYLLRKSGNAASE